MEVGVDTPLHLHPCPTMGVVTEGKIVEVSTPYVNKIAFSHGDVAGPRT